MMRLTIFPNILIINSFWGRVKKTDKCWFWTGGKNKSGYGKFKFWGKYYVASRVAYFLYYNKQPGQLLVCHACDTTICVNPKHLFLGTYKDNSQDRIKKFGTLRPGAKLSWEIVNKMRELYISGMTQKEIQELFFC
jgi:hypothetical protein